MGGSLLQVSIPNKVEGLKANPERRPARAAVEAEGRIVHGFARGSCNNPGERFEPRIQSRILATLSGVKLTPFGPNLLAMSRSAELSNRRELSRSLINFVIGLMNQGVEAEVGKQKLGFLAEFL